MRKIALLFSTLLLFIITTGPVFAQSTGEFEPTIVPNNIVVDTDSEIVEEDLMEGDDVDSIPDPAINLETTAQSAPIPIEEEPGTFETLVFNQNLGSWTFNPIKYAIRNAIAAGIAAETIVLLLLLPVITTFIAAARHLIGLRGFGIFLPAALAAVFIAIGPVLGIGLFLFIVLISTTARILLRRSKIRLQYLPRMSLILLFVVLGVMIVLFAAPYVSFSGFVNVSIFPILILILLAEEFSKVQLGKSAKIAVNLTTETLILALASYVVLTWEAVQIFALTRPELLIILLIITNILLGKYVGLRFAEYWRFRKIISG